MLSLCVIRFFISVSSVALLFIILMVLRRRKDTDGELSVARAPLLRKERPQGRYYGMPCDAEPVYAGWWTKGTRPSFPKTVLNPIFTSVPTENKRTDALTVLWKAIIFFKFEYIIEKQKFLWVLVAWHCYSCPSQIQTHSIRKLCY